MATDAELVKRVQRGESEAYAELFRRHYQHIYAICVSLVRNPHDAEELAQEMFVLAYLKVGQLRDPARFFPWLRKMARNRSRNFVQRERDNVTPLSLVDTEQPDEHVLRQELMQAIMDAIEALPEKDRQVIKARIDGLSHAEISRRFDISYQASLSRLYRSRKKLADHLRGLYSAFGLVVHLKEIISGGIVAMKIGTGVKVTIGVIGVLTAGFITFQIATNQPEQEVPPADQVIQEPSAKPLVTPGTVQQKPEGKEMQAQTDSTIASSDSPEESVSAEEAEKFLAILDQMDKAQDSEETVESEGKGPFSGLTPERRAILETRRAIMEDELKTELADLISIGDEMQEYLQSRGQNPADDSADKWNWYVNTDKEVQERWTEICDVKIGAYVGIRLRLEGKNFRHPLATGGFLYEMAQRLPPNMVPRSVSGNGFIDRIPDRQF